MTREDLWLPHRSPESSWVIACGWNEVQEYSKVTAHRGQIDTAKALARAWRLLARMQRSLRSHPWCKSMCEVQTLLPVWTNNYYPKDCWLHEDTCGRTGHIASVYQSTKKPWRTRTYLKWPQTIFVEVEHKSTVSDAIPKDQVLFAEGPLSQ